jgi:hypothetical protein
LFAATKKVVDTGLRRHDGVGSSGGSNFTAVGIKPEIQSAREVRRHEFGDFRAILFDEIASLDIV